MWNGRHRKLRVRPSKHAHSPPCHFQPLEPRFLMSGDPTATGSVEGYVWYDNGNGVWEKDGTNAERALPGIEVALYPRGGMMSIRTTTDANGKYFFQNLQPHEYQVREETFGVTVAATIGESTLTPNGGETLSGPWFGVQGQFYQGPLSPEGHQAVGRLWNDLNANGVKDADEPALAGWKLILNYTSKTSVPNWYVMMGDYTNDRNVRYATTNAEGYFSFSNLFDGTPAYYDTYQIRYIAPEAGWQGQIKQVLYTLPDDTAYTFPLEETGCFLGALQYQEQVPEQIELDPAAIWIRFGSYQDTDRIVTELTRHGGLFDGYKIGGKGEKAAVLVTADGRSLDVKALREELRSIDGVLDAGPGFKSATSGRYVIFETLDITFFCDDPRSFLAGLLGDAGFTLTPRQWRDGLGRLYNLEIPGSSEDWADLYQHLANDSNVSSLATQFMSFFPDPAFPSVSFAVRVEDSHTWLDVSYQRASWTYGPVLWDSGPVSVNEQDRTVTIDARFSRSSNCAIPCFNWTWEETVSYDLGALTAGEYALRVNSWDRLIGDATLQISQDGTASVVRKGPPSFYPGQFVLIAAATFDEPFYLAANSDVAAAVAVNTFSSGLEHYLRFGKAEGRLSYAGEVKSDEGRRTVPRFTAADLQGIFNESYYLANNPDVREAVESGLVASGLDHFLQFGEAEGRRPCQEFDEQGYLTMNQDVSQAVQDGTYLNGFEHYVLFGRHEGRLGERFDASAYLAMNSDVRAAVAAGVFASAYEHYCLFGRAEGRKAYLDFEFNEQDYLANNPDVAEAVAGNVFYSGLEHYLLFGRHEGRGDT